MNDKQTPTETMKISDVRSQLNRLVNRAYHKETRVIVEKSGIPVAGIVSARDLERLKRLDDKRAERWRVLEAMRAPVRDVPSEEIERETNRIMEEIREGNRRARQPASCA